MSTCKHLKLKREAIEDASKEIVPVEVAVWENNTDLKILFGFSLLRGFQS